MSSVNIEHSKVLFGDVEDVFGHQNSHQKYLRIPKMDELRVINIFRYQKWTITRGACSLRTPKTSLVTKNGRITCNKYIRTPKMDELRVNKYLRTPKTCLVTKNGRITCNKYIRSPKMDELRVNKYLRTPKTCLVTKNGRITCNKYLRTPKTCLVTKNGRITCNKYLRTPKIDDDVKKRGLPEGRAVFGHQNGFYLA
jgi:hypothetical protein